jgi:large subunit ribosomal protein L4
MKLKVLKLNNSSTEVSVDVNPEVKLENLDYEVALLNRVKNQAEKQGTKKAKGRSEVRGHGKKPYKQKHTGNARQGSTKGPHMRGGGVAHGPKLDWTKLDLNKKAKKAYLQRLLVNSISKNELNFVELEDKKEELRKFFVGQPKSLMIYSDKNKDKAVLVRNLSNVKLLNFNSINPFDLISQSNILVDLDSKEELLNILKA